MNYPPTIGIDTAGMLPAGTVLRGTYRIDAYLASGGFGNTYVVTHMALGDRLVVKEFFMKSVSTRLHGTQAVRSTTAENRATFDSQLHKFMKEARRMRQLHNEHIVHIYDLFEENGTAYYVMDYIDGCSLKAYVGQHGPLGEDEVRGILLQVLDALDCIHGQHLQHLDLKPANILVDKAGKVTLIDFGASKQTGTSADTSTVSVTMAYTQGYAPSEQVEQNIHKIGPWTDLYALGATAYNLLTGEHPPLSSTITDEEMAAFHFPSSVSNDMVATVMWLMSPSRDMRPQSAREVLPHIKGRSKLLRANDATPISDGHNTDYSVEVVMAEPVVQGKPQQRSQQKPAVIPKPQPKAQVSLQPKHQPRQQPEARRASAKHVGHRWLLVVAIAIIVAGVVAFFLMRRHTSDSSEPADVPETAIVGICPDSQRQPFSVRAVAE